MATGSARSTPGRPARRGAAQLAWTRPPHGFICWCRASITISFPRIVHFKLKQSLNHSTRVLREWRAVQKFTRGFCWIKRFSSFITSKIVNSVSWLNDKWTTSKDRDIHPCVALTLQPLVVLSTAESHPPHTNNYIRLVITPGYPSLRSSNTATLLLTLQSRSCVENCV